MIKDCFPYFNERELLELRINLLKDHIDEFVICEANRTHSGVPKEYTLEKTLNELNIPLDKIRVVKVELPDKEAMPDDYDRERMQRNAAAEYIGYGDIAFVSDCDEIMNPSFIAYYSMVAQNNPNSILRLPMVFLMGRADMRAYDTIGQPINWSPGFVCMGHHKERYTLSEIRESQSRGLFNVVYKDIFTVDEGRIKDAGWHFSWMGGGERMKIKYRSFMHYQDDIPMAAGSGNKQQLEEFIGNHKVEEGSTDPLGRANHIMHRYEVKELPEKIFELPRVQQFLFAE
jgi:beta-1,4-mannosyl-glycoprotein beta-1,4-N-acetylglucosaminyltransferase